MSFNHNYDSKLSNDVVIWDETLRDGEQSPGVAFSLEQKVKLAKLLDEIGVRIIDIGFPAVSVEEQKTIKKIVSLGLKAITGVTVRANKDDIDCAIKCGINTVFLFAPTSKLHIKLKFGVDYEKLKNIVFGSIDYALNKGLDIYFISEDTSRSELEFIIPFFDQIYEHGVDKIILTDTVGIMLPFTMKKLVAKIINKCNPDIKFGIHCHNDFGLATANTLAAIESGITYSTVTVNGIGERAGNASFEEVVAALELIYHHKTGILLNKIGRLSKMVELYSGFPISPHKPLVGYNAFRHESGVHVQSLLKDPESYETISPCFIGKKREFVLGKHTGRALLKHILQQKGIKADESLLEYLLASIKTKNNNPDKEKIYKTIQNYYRKCLGLSEERLYELLITRLNNRL